MPPTPHIGLGVLSGVVGGPATYGRRLAGALAARDDLRLTVLTDRPEGFPAACRVVHVPFRGGIDRLRWQHLALPRAVRRAGVDLYHDTKNALPRGLGGRPAVVTVHDFAHVRLPGTFGRASRWFLRRATAGAVKRADRVIVPSRATADDLAAFHPEHAARTRVVAHGIDPATPPRPGDEERVRAAYGLPEPYVLHVGTIQRRKNVDLLVRAVRSLRARGWPHRLVLVGRRGWLAQEAMAEIGADDTARWLGTVPAEDLPALYSMADVFASPSSYEGFGFTVADALAHGTPVVASGVTSLPEVVDDAGVLLSAIDEPHLIEALEGLLADPGRRRALAAAGRARVAGFTWERAASATCAVYREILREKSGIR